LRLARRFLPHHFLFLHFFNRAVVVEETSLRLLLFVPAAPVTSAVALTARAT
jgi:hypothetical protein